MRDCPPGKVLSLKGNCVKKGGRADPGRQSKPPPAVPSRDCPPGKVSSLKGNCVKKGGRSDPGRQAKPPSAHDCPPGKVRSLKGNCVKKGGRSDTGKQASTPIRPSGVIIPFDKFNDQKFPIDTISRQQLADRLKKFRKAIKDLGTFTRYTGYIAWLLGRNEHYVQKSIDYFRYNHTYVQSHALSNDLMGTKGTRDLCLKDGKIQPKECKPAKYSYIGKSAWYVPYEPGVFMASTDKRASESVERFIKSIQKYGLSALDDFLPKRSVRVYEGAAGSQKATQSWLPAMAAAVSKNVVAPPGEIELVGGKKINVTFDKSVLRGDNIVYVQCGTVHHALFVLFFCTTKEYQIYDSEGISSTTVYELEPLINKAFGFKPVRKACGRHIQQSFKISMCATYSSIVAFICLALGISPEAAEARIYTFCNHDSDKIVSLIIRFDNFIRLLTVDGKSFDIMKEISLKIRGSKLHYDHKAYHGSIMNKNFRMYGSNTKEVTHYYDNYEAIHKRAIKNHAVVVPPWCSDDDVFRNLQLELLLKESMGVIGGAKIIGAKSSKSKYKRTKVPTLKGEGRMIENSRFSYILDEVKVNNKILQVRSIPKGDAISNPISLSKLRGVMQRKYSGKVGKIVTGYRKVLQDPSNDDMQLLAEEITDKIIELPKPDLNKLYQIVPELWDKHFVDSFRSYIAY